MEDDPRTKKQQPQDDGFATFSVESSTSRLLRGPLLVSVVFSWFVLPHVLLHWQTVVTVLLLLVGLVVCLYDAGEWLTEQARCSLRKQIERIALDDVLKVVHKAEMDAVGGVVGAVMGQAVMYGLPCTTQQRIRLLQSGLEVRDEREARRILLEPGGWRCFLPQIAQDWLFANTSKKQTLEEAQEEEGLSVEAPDSDLESNHSQSDDTSELYEAEKDRIRERSRETGPFAATVGTCCPTAAQSTTPIRPHLPVEQVFGSILKEMILEAWNRHSSAVSFLTNKEDRTLEIASLLASALFLGHIGWSRRSRELIRTVFAGATTVGLASTCAVSVGCLVMKHYLHNQQQEQRRQPQPQPGFLSSFIASSWRARIPDIRSLLPTSSSDYFHSLLRKIKEKARDPRWQGAVAALVLLYWGRRRRSAVLQNSSRS